MNTLQDTKTIFFEEFVKRLIISSFKKFPKIGKEDGLFEKLDKTSAIPPAIAIKRKAEEKPLQKAEVKKIEEGALLSEQFVQKVQERPIERIMKPINQEQQMQPQPIIQRIIETQKMPEGTTASVLERLNPILSNPAVQSINCPGPDKNLLVTRMGATQSIPISFTTNEINEFMKDISEKTRIPLLPGLFKVVFQNLIITAVVSEFVGTKFIIEKRAPQTLPQMPIKAQFK